MRQDNLYVWVHISHLGRLPERSRGGSKAGSDRCLSPTACGWKKLENERVSNNSFKVRIKQLTGCHRIHNYYGMVEQTGTIFIECDNGNMHAAAQSDAITRDPVTHRPLPHGATGLIQVFSSIQESYPGHSILTEDLGRTRDGACGCGRTSSIVEMNACPAPKFGVAAMLSIILPTLNRQPFLPTNTASPVPLRCGDPMVLSFCQALSSRLLRDPTSRQFPDVMTFGYFCRKSSIRQVMNSVPERASRLGWGTVLHIAPSNIPVNFAFSFLMGFLSGNVNHVRVPSNSYLQVDLNRRAIDELLAESTFEDLKPYINFSHVFGPPLLSPKKMVSRVAGLVVWGGDVTVAKFKAMDKSLSAIELYFPDRVSSTMLSASEILKLDQSGLENLCDKFFNDFAL